MKRAGEAGESRWRVRPLREADLVTVHALLAAARLPVEGVAGRLDEGYAVVTVEEEVVGAAGIEIHEPDGLLRSVVVAPSWRGRSVGEALVRDRLAWAEERRIRSLYLLTETAASWFERFGFRPVERRLVPETIRRSEEFAILCPTSCDVMRLVLDAR